MATADELLRSTVAQPDPEGHIVVGGDRKITIPANLKRLGVQHDNGMETVVFDCPRYWDDQDMSKMIIYILYMRSDGYKDRYIARNVTVDGDVMHFEWTISNSVTAVPGPISFLVCIKNTEHGYENLHWNSELCQDAYVSPGMEFDPDYEVVYEIYRDLITELLLRMNSVEQINIQADEMQALHDATVEVANTAEEVKNQALDESNYIKNSYANAIKGTASGEIIRVDDVSPIEHQVKCRVNGKNLFGFAGRVESSFGEYHNGKRTFLGNAIYVGLSSSNYYDTSNARYTYDNDANRLTLTGNAWYGIGIDVKIKPSTTYSISGTLSDNALIGIAQFDADGVYITGKACTDEYFTTAPNADWAVLIAIATVSNTEVTFTNIQIEEGSVATAYEPYIDPTAVTVSRSGKNLWHSRDVAYPRTVSGVTVDYDEETQIYTFNGTSTSPGDIYIIPNQSYIMRINAGETWTLRVYPMGGTIDGASTSSGKMSPLVNTGDYTNTIHANTESLYVTKTYTESADIKKMYFYVYASGIVFNNFRCRVQFELSNKPSEFEKSSGIATSIPTSDGTCVVSSQFPTMTLFTDTPGVTIEAEYNVDTVKFLNANIVTDRIQAATDAWLTAHYTEAEEVYF